MKNFETQIKSGEQIQEQLIKNSINDTILDYKLIVGTVLEGNKSNEREQLSDISENSHLTLEQELGKEFGLGKVKLKKIETDFRKPLTVADVLDEGETYWERLNLNNRVNSELYGIAA